MRRREFLGVLGSAGIAWPLAAAAQQPERIRRIGLLMAAGADDPEYQSRIGAFRQGLEQLGWTEGRNARIDIRWATTNADEIRKHAGELTALAPDVILAATGTTTVVPLLEATRAVPIVFVLVIDPVGAGFVSSLARPGGNATGFLMFEYGLSGKWLELLKQIAPSITRVAVLRDAAVSSHGSAGAYAGPHRCVPGRQLSTNDEMDARGIGRRHHLRKYEFGVREVRRLSRRRRTDAQALC